MGKLRTLILVACAALLLPAPVFAGGAGEGGADFLEIPVGARSVGLAGATGSLPGDLASLFRNPALLATERGRRLHLSHQEWFQGLGFESALLAIPMPGDWGRTAVHVRYLHLAPLPAYDSDLQKVDELEVYDLAAGLTWARRVAKRWDFGLSLHSIRQKLGDADGVGWSWDLGAGYIARGVYWSAALRNLGGGVSYIHGKDFPFDRELTLGAARYYPRLGLTFSMEYRRPRYWGSSLRGGCEYMLTEKLVLRAGYAQSFQESLDSAGQPSFGAGLRLSNLGLDYSLRFHDHLGEVHSVSLRLLEPLGVRSPYRFFRPRD